jgi:formylglycine-generating enzyme required for sulfatase activity
VRQTVGSKESRLTTIYRRTQNWLLAIIGDDTIAAKERATAGRILGQVGDPRQGVGVDPATGLPDIVWGKEVPAGTYTVGGDKGAYRSLDEQTVEIQYPYQLSRYPITHAQFQAFVEADDYAHDDWWEGLPADEKKLSDPAFPFDNHPRERVSWYQATAFCRWLSDKVGYRIELPHEYEWEVAARWPDGRFYPWGEQFDENMANTREGNIGQTTAVGIYPANELGLYDLSGNVWEWCHNKFEKRNEDQVDNSGDRRVVRGGSWVFDQGSARAAYRLRNHPDARLDDFGFRVVLVRRSPSHQNDL